MWREPRATATHYRGQRARGLHAELVSLVPYSSHVDQYGFLKPKFVDIREGETSPEFESNSRFEAVQDERQQVPVRRHNAESATLFADDSTNGREAARLGDLIRFSAYAGSRRQPGCLNGRLEVRPCCNNELAFSQIEYGDRLNPQAMRKGFDRFECPSRRTRIDSFDRQLCEPCGEDVRLLATSLGQRTSFVTIPIRVSMTDQI